MEHKCCFGNNNNKEPLINFMFALYLTVTSTHVVPRPPSQQDCQFWASWLLLYYGGRGGSCSHGACGKGHVWDGGGCGGGGGVLQGLQRPHQVLRDLERNWQGQEMN